MSELKQQNYNHQYNFAAMKILLLAFCVYFLVSGPRFAFAIESLEESSDGSDSAEDFEEGFAAATLLAKDTILRKNPANIGNKLKDLWEQIPEHELSGADIKK